MDGWTAHGPAFSQIEMKSNQPMEQIPVPSGLLTCLLLIPLRGQVTCQKQAGIPHRGRWAKKY